MQPPVPKTSDSEKITINLGPVDLGRIDLLVQEGFYANRSDFIRTAIRNQLGTEADAVTRSIERHTLELGLRDIGRAEPKPHRRRVSFCMCASWDWPGSRPTFPPIWPGPRSAPSPCSGRFRRPPRSRRPSGTASARRTAPFWQGRPR